eukprot:417720_1
MQTSSTSSKRQRPSSHQLALQELDQAYGISRKKRKFSNFGKKKTNKTSSVSYQDALPDDDPEKQSLRTLPSEMMVGPLKDDLQLPADYSLDPRGFVQRMIEELLPTQNVRSEDGKVVSNVHYKTKLRSKVLMLANTHKDISESKKRAYNLERARRSRKRMSSREKKAKGLFTLPKDCRKYSMYIPLHKMWLKYVEEAFKDGFRDSGAEFRFLRMDMHGALIKVTRSKCPNYIGLSGIVVQETMQTFRLITEKDRLIVIPKRTNVFSFECAGYLLTLHGSGFVVRPGERVSKKFKAQKTIEI